MKIVKADAKGRVTGFEPGQRYSVVEEAAPIEKTWQKHYDLTPDDIGTVIGVFKAPTFRGAGRDFTAKDGLFAKLVGFAQDNGQVVDLVLEGVSDVIVNEPKSPILHYWKLS